MSGLTQAQALVIDWVCANRDQITQSLERLGTDYVDVYLLHNPEYYLLKNVSADTPQDQLAVHRQHMLNRIESAFEEMEREVARGRIRSYGISSNSFSLKDSDPFFLPYDGLVDLAIRASRVAGNVTHSFSTVQFPANILEQEGLQGELSFLILPSWTVVSHAPPGKDAVAGLRKTDCEFW
jgi:aryl-alcohol dehydrogenase-like predicted oxidoreductase